MDRRNFLFTSTAAAAAAATLGGSARAAEGAPLPSKNLVFTQENAGVWDAKKGSHVPKIEVAAGKVMVSTKHGHSGEHYIVRHSLLLADGSVVGAKTFSPEDEPVSEYELPAGYKGRVFATSFCNKHDLWLAEIVV
jgi:superoxide reductase